MIQKYKTKPVEIEAIEWIGTNANEIINFCTPKIVMTSDNNTLVIPTLEGDMRSDIGDFIIKGLRGEFYPCKPDVFHKKYELIKE